MTWHLPMPVTLAGKCQKCNQANTPSLSRHGMSTTIQRQQLTFYVGQLSEDSPSTSTSRKTPSRPPRPSFCASPREAIRRHRKPPIEIFDAYGRRVWSHESQASKSYLSPNNGTSATHRELRSPQASISFGPPCREREAN